jgi:hypothetical protein
MELGGVSTEEHSLHRLQNNDQADDPKRCALSLKHHAPSDGEYFVRDERTKKVRRSRLDNFLVPGS